MGVYSEMLDDIHQALQNQFIVNEDKENAKKLEDFFNYIVYGKSTNIFDKILSKQLADTIKRNNPELIKAFTASGANAYETGVIGEQAFANLIKRTVEEVAGLKQGSISQNLVSGNELSTVVEGYSEEIMQKLGSRLSSEANSINYRYYAPKQQKTDIKAISMKVGLQPEAQWLLDLSATVKNYHGRAVSLGSASNKKILQSTLYASNINTDKKMAYQKILFSKSKVPVRGAEDKSHLIHIRQIYELTGFGQIGVSQDGNLLGLAQKPNYLMINQIGQRIVIRSTNQLVQEVLNDGKSTRLGKGKTIKYYLD